MKEVTVRYGEAGLVEKGGIMRIPDVNPCVALVLIGDSIIGGAHVPTIDPFAIPVNSGLAPLVSDEQYFSPLPGNINPNRPLFSRYRFETKYFSTLMDELMEILKDSNDTFRVLTRGGTKGVSEEVLGKIGELLDPRKNNFVKILKMGPLIDRDLLLSVSVIRGRIIEETSIDVKDTGKQGDSF